MASRAEWKRRVTQWKKSGLTAEVFAAQRGFKPGTLRWWSSVLRRPAARVSQGGFARLIAVEPPPTTPARPLEPTPLELVLPSGRVVRVRHGFAPSVLRNLLAALETP